MESLINPDLAWSVLFIEGRGHKYPKLRFVAGAFKGDKWSLQHSYFAPDQIAFVNKKDSGGFDTCWRIENPVEDAVFDPIPWRMQEEFKTASKVEIRVVLPLKVCRFCKKQIFSGVCQSGEKALDDIPESLRVSRFGCDQFEFKNRPIEEIRSAVNHFVLPLTSSEPIVFGVCRYCLGNPDERLRWQRARGAIVPSRNNSYDKASLKRRGCRKITQRFGFYKRGERLRVRWEEFCEHPPKTGFVAANNGWKKKDAEDFRRRHIKRRRNQPVNFFAMVDAVGKLGKIQKEN
jgi:hypothetical protein